MIEIILFPTDFSEYGNSALEYVASLRVAGLKKIILLHVLEAEEEYPVALVLRKKALDMLKEKERLLQANGIETDVRVEMGVAHREILRVAEEEDASLIVMGCHGKSLLDELVVGSVSDRVTREAKVPVLLAKFKVLRSEEGVRLSKRSAESFKKILYPTDCSPCAQSVVAQICELKQAGAKEVVIASIIDPRTAAGRSTDVAVNETKSLLEPVGHELEDAGLVTKTVVRIGTPLDELLAIAKEERVSLVVMGSTGKGFFKEMLLGSVSENMIRKAKCPVMVIHDEICNLTSD